MKNSLRNWMLGSKGVSDQQVSKIVVVFRFRAVALRTGWHYYDISG
jgi:hypothetical protein